MPCDYHIAVIGGGIIGCAIAERLSRQTDGIVLLEKESAFGEGVTSRNSGVIHAGLYYTPGSKKARHAIAGNHMLYDWVASHNVNFKKTGKLVVASDAEEKRPLRDLLENANASGAAGLKWVSGDEARAIEPALSKTIIAAIHSPHTGIVDQHGFVMSLLTEAEARHTLALTKTEVLAATRISEGHLLSTSRGQLSADIVVNCGGLSSDTLARMDGASTYRLYAWAGDYYHLRGVSPETSPRTLIYPVKNPHHPGLGIHLTIQLDGRLLLGPDCYLISSENELSQGRSEHKRQNYLEAAKRLLNEDLEIKLEHVTYETYGIRPKLRAPEAMKEADFVIAMNTRGWINCVGIDSPGLTAALSIAEEISDLCSRFPLPGLRH